MATTTNLSLPIIVAGTEVGTWGDLVDNGLTSYLDIAIAGGLAISITGTDVTLANTSGTNAATGITSTTAQYAILNISGAKTAARSLNLPITSKSYIINNAGTSTGGPWALTVRGVTPTTGVTLVDGEKCIVAWSGTDYVKIASSVVTALTGTLTAPNGGTGQSTYAVGDLLYASTTTALSKLADVATGNALISGGVGVAPSWGQIGLTTHVTGTLGTTNGGTGLGGATPFTNRGIVYASSTSALATGTGLQFTGTNLGLGLTPSNWGGTFKVLEFVNNAALWATSSNTLLQISTNFYNDGANVIYSSNNYANYYLQGSTGSHIWYNAPSGTAGNAVSFTQAMTLTNTSQLLVASTVVGIGASQYTNLTVGGNAVYTFGSIKASGGEELFLGALPSAVAVGSYSNTNFYLKTNDTNRALLDTAGNVSLLTGALVQYAPAPTTTISAAASLTNADIQGQVVVTSGTTFTLTMPLGTTLDSLISWSQANLGYDFSVINTASGTITMGTSAGVTFVGSVSVLTGDSARYRIRRIAASTYVAYRLA
jgi:hypothetical protein